MALPDPTSWIRSEAAGSASATQPEACGRKAEVAAPSTISELIWPPTQGLCSRATRGGRSYKMNLAAIGPLPQPQCVALPHPILVYGFMRRQHWYLNQSRVSASPVRWREFGLGSGERFAGACLSSHPRLGELEARLDCCRCRSLGRGR